MKTPVWLVIRRLIGVNPRRYFVGGCLWTLFWVVPLASGLLLKALFDQLSGAQLVDLDAVLWLCAAFVAAEAARGALYWVGSIVWPHWWIGTETTMRANVLRSVLTAPGPAATRLPDSSGEAVSRLRDDVADLTRLTDQLIDLVGTALFAIAAFAIMGSINPLVTAVLVLPLLFVLLLNRVLSAMIRRVHARARKLGAAVTAFIGETFAGVLAVKTAGAESAVLDRLREHNRRRRRAAVKDRLLIDLADTSTGAGVEVSVGLVLLLAAPAMRDGQFTVGDFALFTSYLGWLTALPRMLGRFLYRVPQGAVAVERLTRLMAGHESARDLSRRSGVWFHADPPPAPAGIPSRGDPLQVLEVRGLTVRHGAGDRGIQQVDLRVERGSFTVVTGAVGAGKTTLLRALLGLLPADAGEVRWNGQRVPDPGTFLVPDRIAYAAQVPRLFSDPLRENLRLGWPASDDQVWHAISLAALDEDLAEMSHGLDTKVGPRGGAPLRWAGAAGDRGPGAGALS